MFVKCLPGAIKLAPGLNITGAHKATTPPMAVAIFLPGRAGVAKARTRLARVARKAEKGSDNILSILGDSRRASMDLRALVPNIPASANPGAKFAGLVEGVASENGE